MNCVLIFALTFALLAVAAQDHAVAQEPQWKVFIKAIDEQTGEPVPIPDFEIQVGKEANVYRGSLGGEFTHEFDSREPRYLYLRARAKGYAPMRAFWSNRAGKVVDRLPKSFVFPMQRAISVGGLIVDEDGKPVEGATVFLSAGDSKTHPGRRVNPSFSDEPCVTNKAGQWVCDIVPPNAHRFSIRVQHPEFAANKTSYGIDNKVESLKAKTHEHRIKRGFHVSGRVTDEQGEPVAGAVLAICEMNLVRRMDKYPKTDKNGYYKFPRVAPHRDIANHRLGFSITAISSDLAPQRKMVPGFGDIELGDDPDNRVVDFQLQSGRTVRIQLIDKDKNQIAGASVQPFSWQSLDSLVELRDDAIPLRSNNDGIWQWDHAPPDPIRYIISCRGYSVVNQQLEASGKTNVFTIVMGKPTVILGKVTDFETGLPIKEFVFQRAFEGMAGKPNGLDWVEKTQGRDGQYKQIISYTPSNRSLTFRAMAQGYDTEVSQSIKIEDGTEIHLDFVLQKSKRE